MMFGSWTAERNVSVFCESDDNPNGPPTGDLYQGRNVAQGGRFCDQRNFDMPFIAGVQAGGQLQSAARSRLRRRSAELWRPRTRHHMAAGGKPLYPERAAHASADDHPDRAGIALRRTLGSARCQLQEEHPVRDKVHTFQLDIFNVFNNNSIRTMNDAVGTSLGQVTAIMPGRFPRHRRISSNCEHSSVRKNENRKRNKARVQ